MLERPRILGILLSLILVALASPYLAGIFFFNLANTQISRAVVLPGDAPDRAALLVDAESNLARARALSTISRLPLAEARAAIGRNDLTRALAALDSGDPSLQYDSIAQFDWGDAAWRAGRSETALVHWRSAGAREYFVQEMNRAQYAHRWPDAERSARIAIGIDPQQADAYFVLANALSESGSNVEALMELERARGLTQDKEFLSTILSRKGEVLASEGQFQEALAQFIQARQLAPLDARPRTDYAVFSFRFDPSVQTQSIALLTQVLVDSPWYTAAYIALADMPGTDAEMWLKLGLEKNPNDASLFFALGRWYASQLRISEARTALNAAMRNETRADLLEQIALALAGLPKQ